MVYSKTLLKYKSRNLRVVNSKPKKTKF